MKGARIASIVLAAISALPLLADEGRIPVYQSGWIDEPGSYVVTRDIRVTSGTGIGISSDDVVLDLNGHTISTTDTGWPVIFVSLFAPDEPGVVRIRNGKLVGGQHGISAQSAKQIYIERVEIRDAAQHGIELNQTRYFEVSSCTMVSPGARGINAFGDAETISGRVVDNYIAGSPNIGIYLSGLSDSEVSGNQLELTGGPSYGIGLLDPSNNGRWGNLVARNRITHDGANGLGIGGDTGSDQVIENIVRYRGAAASSGAGIVVSAPGNFLLRNVVSGHRYGIQIYDDESHIEDNKIFANEYGLYFSVGIDNTYRGNVLVGNTTAPVGGDALGDAIDGGGNIP